MNIDNNVVSVTIHDRDYKIKCPADQVAQLQTAARYVDDQMKQIRDNGKINNTERLAIVTALNICHELLILKDSNDNSLGLISQRIHDLQRRIENALASDAQVAL